MENIPPIIEVSKMRPVVFLAVTGLGVVIACSISFLAGHLGFLFGGIDTIFAILMTVPVCVAVSGLTAIVYKRKGLFCSWKLLCSEVLALSLISIGLFSWMQTSQHVITFMNPEPVPDGLVVHHGRSILFNSYVHFTAPPAAIASIIQAKQLVQVPEEISDQPDFSGIVSRQRSKDSWDWWQPDTMSNPRYFYRHHASMAAQGWEEGWWVNDATNEVYALIGG